MVVLFHEAIKNEPDPQLQLDLIKELPAAKLATLGAVHGLTDQLLFAALGKTIRNANPKTRNALLATAISTGKLSTQSGVTEVIQSAIERYGAELPLSDKEALTEYLDSFAAGFAGVLPYGVAGGISARNKQVEAQTKEKLEQEIKDEAANLLRPVLDNVEKEQLVILIQAEKLQLFRIYKKNLV